MADQSQPKNPNSGVDDHLSRLLVPEMEEPFYRSFVRNFKELINPAKLPPLEVTSKPVAVTEVEEPALKAFWRNIKETINPPKLPPLEVTSKPVAVKDIWGLYGRQKKSWAMSTGFQVAAVAAVFILGVSKPGQIALHQAAIIFTPVDTAPPEVKMTPKKNVMQGGGGGGDRSPLPASFGKLPKASLRQFTPPAAVLANLNPKLAMEPTIIAPPDMPLPQVNSANYGDPFSKFGTLSNGTGSGGGIGNGKGGGVGSGDGGGFGPGSGGGAGGGAFKVGGGVTAPSIIKKVEPEYSEEARKAKYAGTVVLYIEVDTAGKATNIRVMHSLGMGLDEKAIEAVKKWVFAPGKKGGVPVPVAATIEVNFRLL